jgi:SpoVK/Ycf46/Vps4 family AAA+-type ATPase
MADLKDLEKRLEEKKYTEVLALTENTKDDNELFIRAKALIGVDKLYDAEKILMALEAAKDTKKDDVTLVLAQLIKAQKRWEEAEWWFTVLMRYPSKKEIAQKALDEIKNYMPSEIDEKNERVLLTRPTHINEITFDDIIGLQKVKAYLNNNIVDMIRNPDFYKELGKKRMSGLIMYGAPGGGKTMFAKALAHQSEAYFISLTLAEIISSYVGGTSKNIEAVWLQARMHKPCIIFIDEIDALATNRGNSPTDVNSSVMRQAVNTLLTELDGIGKDNDGLFIMSATNKPWDVDAAIKRAGRLGNLFYIQLPQYEDRVDFFRKKLKECKVKTNRVTVSRIAHATPFHSFAELELIYEKALDAYILEMKSKGAKTSQEVIVGAGLRDAHFLKAIKEYKSVTREWMIKTKTELIGQPIYGEDGKLKDYVGGKIQPEERSGYLPLLKEMHFVLESKKRHLHTLMSIMAKHRVI